MPTINSCLRVSALALAALVMPTPAAAITPTTIRASLTPAGAEIALASGLPVTSANGRWVAFQSFAGIVNGDENGLLDVYLKDMHTGQVRRVSQRPDGTSGDGPSSDPSISADGRYVAFSTEALNLGTGVTNAHRDVYVYDRDTNTSRRVTTSMTGGDANEMSGELQISHDGSHVVFYSRASDLVAGAGSGQDIFVADVASLTLRRVTTDTVGGAANGFSGGPDVSNGGRFVSFNSEASDLVAGDINGFNDVFVKDVQTGATTRQSVAANGAEGNSISQWTSITADGCLIAFNSHASNLVAGSGTGLKAMVRNRCTPNVEVASVSNSSSVHTVTNDRPDISDDGCAVVFRTGTAIVTPAPGNAAAILRDRCAGTTSRLDVSTAGNLGDQSIGQVRISAGTGRYVSFDSNATNLVPGDGNSTTDAFIRDRANAAPPIADLQVSVSGSSVSVDATASRDPDNGIARATVSFGDGSSETSGLTATHEYTRDGSFTVTVSVTDRDDLTTTASKVVSISGTGDGGGATPPGAGEPPPPAYLPAPLGGALKLELSGGVLARTRFRPITKAGRIGGQRGTTLLLSASEPSLLSLRFERILKGRKAGGRCSPRARRGKRCTLYRPAGATTAKLRRGDNDVPLGGRIKGKALEPGRYRVLARAKASDGRVSQTLVRTFTITGS